MENIRAKAEEWNASTTKKYRMSLWSSAKAREVLRRAENIVHGNSALI